MNQLRLAGSFTLASLFAMPLPVSAWNIPGHMLSGSIAYQILRRETPSTITTVRTSLEQHPWCESHWKGQLEKIPEGERDEMLFMLAPRWADDIRTRDKAQHRGPWHYINFPFKPDGQPSTVRTSPPQTVNILTALAENERIVKAGNDPIRKAIALTWLFHLLGDIHQPLHSVQIFTTDYPNGDRGGNLICVRPSESGKPINLHRFWDGLLASTNNVRTLKNMATELRSRFPKAGLTELASAEPEKWARESFEIATKIAYQDGKLRGTSKGQHRDCREVTEAAILPPGYTLVAKHIAERRIMLAGYRLAAVLSRSV